MTEAQREMVVVMFADVSGYSALAQRDEKLALALVERLRATAAPLLAESGGRLVKTIGDALMVEFRSALSAVSCATRLQQQLRVDNEAAHPDAQLRVRIGLHLGDAVRQGDDLLGDTVNIAARVEPQAPAGGVAMTEAVHQQIRNKFEQPVRLLGHFQLKGIEGKTPLYSVVMPWEPSARAPAPPASKTGRGRPLALAGAFAALAVVGFLVWYMAGRWAASGGAPDKSIAVLPFENLSADPVNGYFAGGIQDEILTLLAQMGDLKVISRTSTGRYASHPENLKAVGHDLGVTTVLEGSVQKAGDEVLINVQLIDVQSDDHIWAQSYQRTMNNVFEVENEVAGKIAEALKVKLAAHEAERLTQIPTQDPRAHDLYLRAVALFDRSDEQSFVDEAALANQALTIDPNYAPAWAVRADAYLSLAYGYRAPLDTYPLARESALKAIAADPGLALGHTELGAVALSFDWNPQVAEQELETAVRLDPNSAYAFFWLGQYHLRVDHDYAKAREAFERCHRLDPLSAWYPTAEANATILMQDPVEALRLANEALNIDPSYFFGTDPVANVYAATGHWHDCARRYEEIASSSPVALNFERAACEVHAGERDQALGILRQLEARSGYLDKTKLAMIYAALGENDKAFDALEQAYRERSPLMSGLEISFLLEPLKSDPRFAALVAKVRRSAIALPSASTGGP